LVTVVRHRPPSRLAAVLLSAAIACALLAWPAIGKQPDKVPPGQAKKAATQVAKPAPPGQAKKAAKAAPTGAPAKAAPGQSTKAAKAAKVPPGQAKKAARQAAPATPPGQVSAPPNAAPRGQAKKAAARRARARARAAARRRAATARRRAATRRAATTPGTPARRAALAATAAAGAAAATAQAPANGQSPERQGKKKRAQKDFVPIPPRDQLPQPFRVVKDIVHVVPTPLRVLIAGLVALAILLAGAAGLTMLRNRRLAKQRRELLTEVGLLQAALLPVVPTSLGPARATVAYRPAGGTAAGGDFYDVLSLGGGRTAVIMGDVSGHGREALARTALARYTLRAYVEAGMQPREALQMAGSVLAGKLEGDFITAMIAVHDAGSATLTYAAAGHPPPIVISGEPFKPVLTAAAPPIGVGATTGQRQTTLPFPRDSIACFYTDGLSEARMQSGRLIGAAGLERIIRSLGPEVTAEQVIDGVGTTAVRIADDAAACVLTAEAGTAIVRSRVESLELTRVELRGPMLRRFLDSCGVSPQAVKAAERTAAETAQESGGAILDVRIGDRSDVDVRALELPVADELTASLRQP